MGITTKCSRAIWQIDFCTTQAIAAFRSGKISESEVWSYMAERKRAELDGMTVSECMSNVFGR